MENNINKYIIYKYIEMFIKKYRIYKEVKNNYEKIAEYDNYYDSLYYLFEEIAEKSLLDSYNGYFKYLNETYDKKDYFYFHRIENSIYTKEDLLIMSYILIEYLNNDKNIYDNEETSIKVKNLYNDNLLVQKGYSTLINGKSLKKDDILRELEKQIFYFVNHRKNKYMLSYFYEKKDKKSTGYFYMNEYDSDN